MSRLYLLILLTILSIETLGQGMLKVNRLHVENVIYESTDSNSFSSLFAENGPCITVYCEIKNNTDKPITLVLGIGEYSGNFIYHFNYRGKIFQSSPVAMIPALYGIIENDTVFLNGLYQLNPGDSLEVFQKNNLLINTSLMAWNKTDYTRVLFEILPTLRIIYEDTDLYFESEKIERVTVDWYYKKE